MNARQHHTYVLRVWQEAGIEPPAWRASLSDISGQEPSSRRYFGDMDTLVGYLENLLRFLSEGGACAEFILGEDLQPPD